MAYYNEKRLMDLAKNILFGMEVVDKRVATRPKNVKHELNEEEQRQAKLETDMYFADKKVQEKLEKLKFLIVDESNQDKLKKMWGDDMTVTPQSTFDSMNAKVKYF